METISFRIPAQLKAKLEQEARDHGLRLSDYCRLLLSQNIILVPNEWKVIMWNALGPDIKTINRSLNTASSVEDFFAGVLNRLKRGVKIQPMILSNKDEVGMTFIIGDKEYNIIVKREPQIEVSISNMILNLEEAIMEGYDEET